jgi:hypothetical protein
MHRTVDQISEFNLHDAPVQAVSRANGNVEVKLEFAFIGKEHRRNPAGKAQLIRPLNLEFENVLEERAQLWSEAERKFEAHPHPEWPIGEEISEFELITSEGMCRVKLNGFHIPSGWSEWHIVCKSISASWEKFEGDAWYES